jgi:DNA polymerase III sliding clamp (beta) subunit (PCNA family)
MFPLPDEEGHQIMKLVCSVGDLLGVVNKVWETTDIKKAAIASNIYLKGIHKANDSWLYVYATDYSIQCLTKVEVDLDEDFEIAVSPEDLVRGIQSLNQETEITLSKPDINSQLLVKAGKVKYKVSCLANISFHKLAMKALPTLNDPGLVLAQSVLKSGIKSVLFAVSANPGMYGVMRSIEIKGNESTIKFSASDGKVAAVSELKCGPLDKEFSINIGKDDINTLIRLINLNPAGEMEIYPEGIYFKFPDTLLVFSKLSGKLPDLKAIINKYPIATSCNIDKKLLLETAKRTSLFTDSRESAINISCNKDGLKFEANEFEEDVTGSFSKDKVAKIDKDYLLNCIQSCSGKTIELCFTDNKVLIIKDLYKEEKVDSTTQYVIMGQ